MAAGEKGPPPGFRFLLNVIGNEGTGKRTFIQCLLQANRKGEQVDDVERNKKYTIQSENFFYEFITTDTTVSHYTASLYREADGFLLLYDITDRQSFDDIKSWVRQISEYDAFHSKPKQRFLVGTKLDLAKNDRQVSEADGRRLCKDINASGFLEFSAKKPTGLKRLLDEVENSLHGLPTSSDAVCCTTV